MGSALASLLLLLSANAEAASLKVDLSSAASIKAGAKVVARNLMAYYHGDEPGQTIGILPGPPSAENLNQYYWWEAGAMWGTLLDYWHYTGDSTYNPKITQAVAFQADGPTGWRFQPLNWTASLGNDDQGFWGMTALLAAELNFPDPEGKGVPGWLEMAQAVFNAQAPRFTNDYCGGGMRWQVSSFNGGYNYKNTIANAIFFNMGARLARYTDNSTYAAWAVKSWDWMAELSYIDKHYNVFDGGDIENNCTQIHDVQFSPNAAVLIQGAAIMYNYTGVAIWKTRVNGLVNRTLDHFFPDGIMVERACELADKMQCNIDQHSFKGYMHRALATAAMVGPPELQPLIFKYLKSSTAGCVKSCLDDGTCGFRWTIGKYDNDVDDGPAGQQMSAVAALSTVLLTLDIASVKPPVTNSTGGTSKGDPDAGNNAPDVFAPLPVTTAGRGGAGFLTAFVLASMMGAFVWMTFGWSEGSA
ncbi:glycoside hydrolase family 76 protein [Cercophora scortea]|uniref:Mannan endo-1,6-alpha-mannosidase n=1 Tax=Cercophora scortea TaxID=314031 RepID=A0AAE0I8K6_9PEZI|nr:glycoside hydrolase family 76 protein [Cercophora scortea]